MNRIDGLLSEVINEIKEAGISPSDKICPTVVINGRAKSRFGCCKTDMRTGVCTIELSDQLVCCEDKYIKSVLAHEVLHTCRGCRNHGALWKSYAARLGELYDYRITAVGKPEDYGLGRSESDKTKQEPLYVLKCEGCGLEIPRMRMSKSVKYPQMYRCPKCGNKIKRIK